MNPIRRLLEWVAQALHRKQEACARSHLPVVVGLVASHRVPDLAPKVVPQSRFKHLAQRPGRAGA